VEQPDPATPPAGLLASARGLGATIAALVQTRIELAVVELQEEGERRKAMLVLAVVAGVFLTMAALLLAFFVVVVFWDEHRIAAAGGVTALYLGVGVIALLRMQSRARNSPPPFEATLGELRKDLDAMKATDG
jgi:uncharacterized membrane protein YqjE